MHPPTHRIAARAAALGLAAALLVGVLAAAGPGAAATSPEPPPWVPSARPRTPDLSAQIIGGSAASLSEFPWITAILASGEPDPFLAQFCGGVRVSQTKVLTAAHCVRAGGVTAPPWALDIVHGTTSLTPGSGTRVPVTAVAVHPSFSEATFRNDVAVLTVAAPRTAVPTIEVITPEAESRTVPGAPARLAGWGCTQYSLIANDCAQYSQTLRRADLAIAAASTCAPFGTFDAATMLCGGPPTSPGSTANPCYADSGGPLVVTGARGPLVAGLVSFGVEDCSPPAGYARLSRYRSWLAANGVPLRAAPFRSVALGRQVGGSFQPLTGDFNGDGWTDIYWYAPGPATDALWLGTIFGPSPAPTTRQVSGTYTPVVGDFNADGRDDIFWYAPGPAAESLWGAGPSATFTPRTARQVNGSYVPLAGDFDGNGGDDIFWYGVGAAAEARWVSSPSDPTWLRPAAVTATFDGEATPVVGDFDGNGRDDIYWDAPGSGADALWRGSGSGPVPGTGSVLQIGDGVELLPGDFDGDGLDDLFSYGPGGAIDLIWRGTATGFGRQTDVVVGGNYVAATGDLNGDGRDDVLWHGPGSLPDSWFAGVKVP